MSDQIVVHTMKDDIAEMNSLPPVASPAASKQKHEKPQAPVFSLPSKSTTPNTVNTANPAKKRKNILIGVSCIVLFLVLAFGAVYAYMQWGNLQAPKPVAEQEILLNQIIPKEALAIIDYNLQTPENRDAVADMWAVRTDTSANDITSGNPTSLLGVSDVSHLYYVIMPEAQEPFVVLKKTDGLQQYVTQQSAVQPFEKGGWYVMHNNSLVTYSAALATGSIAEDNPLLSSIDTPNYLIRYAMSPSFVSQQLTTITASGLLPARADGLVFQIVSAGNDGTIRAFAHVSGNPPGEGVPAQTAELISLIPGDLTFAHVGLSFAEELATLEGSAPLLDTAILAQPAVRQFTSLFTTPYALFERKGSDGVRDIGLVLTLPGSLKQAIKTGEPIVEQSLPALIPLIMGKALGIQVAFNDGLMEGIPVRYVNISGQSQTLDYSIGDNFLLISSSREGMSSLLETSLTPKEGLSLEEPWKSLGDSAGITSNSKQFIAGTLTDPAILSLLPISSDSTGVPIIISSGKTSTGTDIEVVLSTK